MPCLTKLGWPLVPPAPGSGWIVRNKQMARRDLSESKWRVVLVATAGRILSTAVGSRMIRGGLLFGTPTDGIGSAN